MSVTKHRLPCNLVTAAARLAIILAVWLLWPAVHAQAAIYACPTANGDTKFQDRPCEIVKAEDPTKTETETTKRSEYPLGLHPSWFISPQFAPQPAYCDRLGCDCATQTCNFRRGLGKAVADALFLEATWHRYSEQVIRMETDPPEGLAYLQLQVDIEELACDIQMSQATVRNYAARAVKQLEMKANQAEERGNTDYSQCVELNSSVCDDVDDYQLYQRVLMDLETLRSPRSFFMAEAG